MIRNSLSLMEPQAPNAGDSRGERRVYWARKLRRLQLDAEPIEEQLARYKRVTWALTVIPSIMALMFIALFSAFRRPDLGLLVALVLFGPVVTIAWLDYKALERNARAYLVELNAWSKTAVDDMETSSPPS